MTHAKNSLKLESQLPIVRTDKLSASATLLVLDISEVIGKTIIVPGQFVEVLVEGADCSVPGKPYLRRPISVNFVDAEHAELWLLVKNLGIGTDRLCALNAGEKLNILFPLGIGFSIPGDCKAPLLVGGGIGTAPLLYLGKQLADSHVNPTFLLAARTADELLQLDEFRKYGRVLIATDDGSTGFHGLVTQHPALSDEAQAGEWSHIFCCGPLPMMKAVARRAKELDIPCQVSLENRMACGLGACLCCVEELVDEGNVCVCQQGPVFNSLRLKWFD